MSEPALSDRAKEFRVANSLSVEAAAAAADISPPTYRKVEAGENVSEETQEKVQAWIDGLAGGDDGDVVAPAAVDRSAARRDRGGKPVKVLIELEPEVHQETKVYWCGLMEGSGYTAVSAGGQSFPVFTEIVEPSVGGTTKRTAQQGILARLTESQVARIIDAIKNRVIRFQKNGKATIQMRDARRYRPERGDMPLAKFVYMVELESEDDLGFVDPIPMLQSA